MKKYFFWGFGIIIVIFFLTILIMFFKTKMMLENPAFYVSFFSMFTIVMVVIVVFALSRLGDKKFEVDNTDINYYFNKINQRLQEMPNTSTLIWDGGKNVRYVRKSFGKAGDFLGVIAERSSDETNVNVIAKIDKKEVIIMRHLGDPNRFIIADPFYEFNPTHQDNYNLYTNIARSQRRTPTTPIIINPGQQSGGFPQDEFNQTNNTQKQQ